MEEKKTDRARLPANTESGSSGLQRVSTDHALELVPRSFEHIKNSDPEVIPKAHFGDEHVYWTSEPHDTAPLLYHAQRYPSAFRDKPVARTWCGLRKKVVIIVGIVVLLLITIAVVLGATLGTVLNKKGSSASPPAVNNTDQRPLQVANGSGLAWIVATNEGGMYTYYQASNGSILETFISDKNLSNGQSGGLVTDQARIGSPLAATSYISQGATFRTIFFVTNYGRVMTTNTTGGGEWSLPYPVSDIDAGEASDVALSACSGTTSGGLNGIRVYFGKCNLEREKLCLGTNDRYIGSQLGYIQEVGLNFPDAVWYTGFPFEGSDPTSGVASVLADTVNHVYLRNRTTGLVQQWQCDYSPAQSKTWTTTGQSPANASIESGSDIAAVYDGSGTDYIYWQSLSGVMNRGVFSSSGNNLTCASTAVLAMTGSKLVAIYQANASDSGTLLAFTSPSNASAVEYLVTGSDGAELAYGLL